MIDWLTNQISKYESLDNNNKEVKEFKEEQNLGRDNTHDYIRRMKESISSKGNYAKFDEFFSG